VLAQPPTDYRAYPLKHQSAAYVEKVLAEKLASVGSATHVVADTRSNQVLVQGSEQSQQIARRVIESLDRPAANPAGIKELFIPLLHTRASDMEAILQQRFRDRLTPLTGARPGCAEYRYVSPRGGRVQLSFDRQRNGVTVSGASSAAVQWGRLMHSLDAPPPTDDQTTEVLPLYRADPRKVQEAVDASRAALNPNDRNSRRSASPDDRQGRALNQNAIRLVGHLFQAKEDEPGTLPVANPAASGGEEKKLPAVPEDRLRRLRDLGLDVEIETLPDLDAIIIRGRKRDVEETKRIIEEIERLSAEAEPVIEVVHLRYVQGEALSDIIRQVQADVLSGHQGRVTLLPLGKPNALLLIGWGETVKKAKELIAKLDQPVDPQTQQRVYRLRHASATSVATTLTQFFSTPTGLQPRIHVTADARTNSLAVRAAPRDLAEIELLLQKLDSPDSATVFRTRIFKLYNTLASDVYATLHSAIEAARGGGTGTAAQKSAALELLAVDPQNPDRARLLRSGILNDVRITPDSRLNILLVAAPPESMELLAALIKELDAPGAIAQIKVFRIVNGDANTMSQMLRSLLPAQTGAAGPQLSAAEGEPSTMGLRFSTDARTNAIIAIGSAGDLRIVEALILRLDALDVQERKTTVVRLKNSPANDVANAVNRFLSSERLVHLAAAGATSPFQQLESEVVVVPEPVSNSLIISATPRFYKEITELVEKLDAQPSQVMIQVLIAEVTLGSADEFGIELGLQDSVLFDRSVLSGNLATQTTSTQVSTPAGITTSTEQSFPAATLSPGYLFNAKEFGNGATNRDLSGRIGSQGLSNFGLGRINSDLGFGGLVLSASSDAVSVLIRSLQESHRLEVLGRPHIMTLDNQPAYIQIGQRVPRVTGNMVSTAGVGQVYNTFELVNVGLILGVTPRISPDGTVVMEIDAEKSSVNRTEGLPLGQTGTTADSTSGIRSPAFDTTMAQTTVSATDGETIVLGGLIEKRDENLERKVPYLADIPLVGNLFRYHFERSSRKELLIVLTPHVVRNQEEAERIKRIESARMHWCLQTVQDIHCDGGLTSATDAGQVIYPDEDPWGGLPAGVGQVAPPKSGAAPQALPNPAPAGQPLVPGPVQPDLAPPVQPPGAVVPADATSRGGRGRGPAAHLAQPSAWSPAPLPTGSADAAYYGREQLPPPGLAAPVNYNRPLAPNSAPPDGTIRAYQPAAPSGNDTWRR
jgi:type II secretion system protein D